MEGVCDDGVGRVDGGQGLCSPGSDCADCGVRIFCLEGASCPQVCHERALRNPESACLEHMLSNGICDPQCNK